MTADVSAVVATAVEVDDADVVVVVVARGNDASVGGGGVRTSQTAPAHTMTVATDVASNRPTPNHSTHARARSVAERGATGLDNGSTIDLLDEQRTIRAHDAPITGREPVAPTLPPPPVPTSCDEPKDRIRSPRSSTTPTHPLR
jgi:hypothetical protein